MFRVTYLCVKKPPRFAVGFTAEAVTLSNENVLDRNNRIKEKTA